MSYDVISRAGVITRALPDENIQGLIDILERRSGTRMAMEEGREAARNLIGFFYILMEWDKEDAVKRASTNNKPAGKTTISTKLAKRKPGKRCK